MSRNTMYLWAFVVCYALVPFLFFEAAVSTRVSSLFFALGRALNGFTLALLYFSPVARYFSTGPSARV
jgi:hypothetical protein